MQACPNFCPRRKLLSFLFVKLFEYRAFRYFWQIVFLSNTEIKPFCQRSQVTQILMLAQLSCFQHINFESWLFTCCLIYPISFKMKTFPLESNPLVHLSHQEMVLCSWCKNFISRCMCKASVKSVVPHSGSRKPNSWCLMQYIYLRM